DSAAVREVADDQQVAVGVRTREVETAANALVAEADRVLEEPETLLRVAVVVVAVRAEVEELARDVRVEGRLTRAAGPVRAGGRSRRQRRVGRRPGVARREAVQEVVLVREAAGIRLPDPVRNVLRILGAAGREDRRVEGAVVDPVDSPRARRIR